MAKKRGKRRRRRRIQKPRRVCAIKSAAAPAPTVYRVDPSSLTLLMIAFLGVMMYGPDMRSQDRTALMGNFTDFLSLLVSAKPKQPSKLSDDEWPDVIGDV